MRIQPRWWIGLGVYLAYMGWVFAAWTYLDIDYAALGAQANLLRGIIVPLGIAAIMLCIFNGLAGWWPQATREPVLRQPLYLAAVLVPMLGFIGMNLYSTVWAAIGIEHVLVLAAAMLLVGFCEEMVHRGILLVGLRHSLRSEAWVWFWSSALFGLLHATNAFFGVGAAALVQVVLAFCAGTGLYLVRRLTGSLWVAMALHALWDFSSIAQGLGRGPQSLGALVFLGGTYVASIAVVVLVLRRGAGAGASAKPGDGATAAPAPRPSPAPHGP